MKPLALPEGLASFKVTWNAWAGITDGPLDADDDPDIVMVDGEVVFTPKITDMTLISGVSASLFLTPVVCQVVNGRLLHNGREYISLISPFSTGLIEKGWTWSANFKVNGYTKAKFDFQGEPGLTYNLATLQPVAIVPGTITIAGPPGAQVEMQKSDTAIQWRYIGDTVWQDLVLLTEITGPAGTGTGDGREVVLRNDGTYIQWQYSGDTLWTNLVALTAITGPAGADGVTSTYVANEILTHVNDTTPHPAYDDMQSLVLLFENGLI